MSRYRDKRAALVLTLMLVLSFLIGQTSRRDVAPAVGGATTVLRD